MGNTLALDLAFKGRAEQPLLPGILVKKKERRHNLEKVHTALWGFLHLKSELIREAENQKTDKNHRKTVKYGSIFEGEITKQLKK